MPTRNKLRSKNPRSKKYIKRSKKHIRRSKKHIAKKQKYLRKTRKVFRGGSNSDNEEFDNNKGFVRLRGDGGGDNEDDQGEYSTVSSLVSGSDTAIFGTFEDFNTYFETTSNYTNDEAGIATHALERRQSDAPAMGPMNATQLHATEWYSIHSEFLQFFWQKQHYYLPHVRALQLREANKLLQPQFDSMPDVYKYIYDSRNGNQRHDKNLLSIMYFIMYLGSVKGCGDLGGFKAIAIIQSFGERQEEIHKENAFYETGEKSI
jgi:hypothetical protein